MLSGEGRGGGILSGERSGGGSHWREWRGGSVLSGTRGKVTAVSQAGSENSETVAILSDSIPYIESTTVLSDYYQLFNEQGVVITKVNEKFHKLERVYRDCIKRTRYKTRIIQYIYRMMYQALDA